MMFVALNNRIKQQEHDNKQFISRTKSLYTDYLGL